MDCKNLTDYPQLKDHICDVRSLTSVNIYILLGGILFLFVKERLGRVSDGYSPELYYHANLVLYTTLYVQYSSIL